MPAPIATLKGPLRLRGVLCDIDDTITWEGKIIPGALQAMEQLRAAGLAVVPVTGRPGGWVDHIARMWPVDGVVGENGGLWYWMDHSQAPARLARRFLQGQDERADNQLRLRALGERILAAVPGAALASDQPYRELDLAVDFCEDVPALDDAAIDRIVALFEAAGATAKISSIHVNGWYGAFDKLRGIERFHLDRWGTPIDPTAWAFFGDSGNDEPMFRAFPLSVGVRNVERFLPRMAHPPAWITDAPGGHGFIEGVARLLALQA